MTTTENIILHNSITDTDTICEMLCYQLQKRYKSTQNLVFSWYQLANHPKVLTCHDRNTGMTSSVDIQNKGVCDTTNHNIYGVSF